MKYFHIALLSIMSAFIHTCAADPDLGEASGVCQLNCSGTKIASHEMAIRFQHEDEIEIACHGVIDDTYFGTVPVRFLIERPKRNLPADPIPGSEDSDDAPPGPLDETTLGIPVSGISFEALVVSGLLEGENPEDERFKYKGINTPVSEWCTDSCGVGAIDVTPLCKSGSNEISLLIRSGPVAKLLKIKVTQ